MSTRSAIVRNAVANLALPAAAVLTGPLLARALGVEGRGALAAVLAVLTLATFLAPLGMQEALVYAVSRKTLPLRHALRISVETGLLCGSVAAVLVALSAPLLLRDAPETVWLLQAVTLTIPFAVIGMCLRGVAQGQQRFNLMARERWSLGLVRLPLIVALFAAGVLTVTTAAWINALVPLVAMLALVPALRRRGPAEETTLPLRHHRKQLVGYSFRTAPGSMLAILGARVDQILLAPVAGLGQLGLYAVAVALSEIPLSAVNAVRDVVHATSTSRNDPALIARTTRTLVLITMPVVILGIAVTPIVLPLLFGENFTGAVPLAQILLAGLICHSTVTLLSTGMLSLGRPGLRSLVQIGSNATRLVLLVILIPLYGATGAAVGAFVMHALTAGLFVYFFSRHAGLRARDCFVPTWQDVQYLAGIVGGLLGRGKKS